MSDQTEFAQGLYKNWFDFNKKMMENSMDMTMKYWKPEHYEKMYSQWSSFMSDMMTKMMTQPGFTDKCWKSFKQTAGFQKFWEEANKEYFKNLNMPTREEFDELTARMDYLDDQLEELRKKTD